MRTLGLFLIFAAVTLIIMWVLSSYARKGRRGLLQFLLELVVACLP